MRIVIILGPFLPIPPVFGGAVEKAHVALSGAYRAAGHDVTIISRRFSDFPTMELVGGVVYRRIKSYNRTSSFSLNLIFSLIYAVRAAAITPRADVTITNEFFLPIIIPKRKAGKIYVQVGRFPKFQMFLYFRADRLQAVSSHVSRAICRQTPWLARKVRTVGCPIPDNFFCTSHIPRRRIILFVGRIAREKGVEILIKAMLLLHHGDHHYREKGWKLCILGPHESSKGGDGAGYLRQLKELAQPLGDQCEFAGAIFDQDELRRKYEESSIFVYPSLSDFGEALGMAPLEAMACGCATVVSDLRCFDDYIRNGVTGLTFDHRSHARDKHLAIQIARLLQNPDLITRLSKAGYQAARDFNVHRIAERMLEDFKTLTEHALA